MLPPILEIYGVWHPKDVEGTEVVQAFADHFHGTACTGLLRGTVEVYRRSTGWADDNDAPRPITLPGQPVPTGQTPPAEWVTVVIVIGPDLIEAAQEPGRPWWHYIDRLQQHQHPRLKILTVLLPGTRLDTRTKIGSALSHLQALGQLDASRLPSPRPEQRRRTRCRDLVQTLAQWMGNPTARPDIPTLKVFISHTKHQGSPDEPVQALIDQVHDALRGTRLDKFFDSNSLQNGDDWDATLRREASQCAMLALRTDKYSSREWCQREMRLAKQHGCPVIILDALTHGERRGSFLMDHVPRIPVRNVAEGTPPTLWCANRIETAINQLVDAWLERIIWDRQEEMCRTVPLFAEHWWAPQPPEPSTLSMWLSPDPQTPETPVLPIKPHLKILHPDPPLAEDERRVLGKIAALAGVESLELTTPRLLAARSAGSMTTAGITP